MTPSIIRFLDSIIRRSKFFSSLIVTSVSIVGLSVMYYYAMDNVRARLLQDSRDGILNTISDIIHFKYKSEFERYGEEFLKVVEEINHIGHNHGIRIGLVTPQYWFEGIAFGYDYRNILVPLSYNLPRTLEDLEKLQLEALWIAGDGTWNLQLFKQHVTERKPNASESWRITELEGFDVDFENAHELSVFYQDISPFVDLLENSITWHPLLWDQQGILFVKNYGKMKRPSLLGVINRNGIEKYDGKHFIWIGEGETLIRAFAVEETSFDLTGDILLGPSIPDVGSRRIQIKINNRESEVLRVSAGQWRYRVDAAKGVNLISIVALDKPTVQLVGENDTRPLILGVRDLKIE